MKKALPIIISSILFIGFIVIIILLQPKIKKVTYGSKAVLDVDISEVIEDDWFDYSYFWQQGRDENGKELTIVTIYWSKVNEEGVTTYVTDGEIWEIVK